MLCTAQSDTYQSEPLKSKRNKKSSSGANVILLSESAEIVLGYGQLPQTRVDESS